MVDPVVMMLDDMIEEDIFSFSLAKKKYEDSLYPILYKDIDFYNLPLILDFGSGIFIGRHGYSGMGDFYSGTHGNTGMGFF